VRLRTNLDKIMVHFKVTNGLETRRFKVTPGELTFEQLKEKIDTLFPDATKETSNLALRYRDTDGDVITLSSDEEFQEVLKDLPENYVWKLHITSPAFNSRRDTASEVEELMRLLFGLPESTSAKSGENSTPKQQTQDGQSAQTESPKAPREGEDGSPGEGGEASPKENKEEEVKSKSSGDKPSHYRVGLWDLFPYGGLFGPSRVFSAPVRHHITWGPRGCCSCTTAACA
jgi:hypothetical protein